MPPLLTEAQQITASNLHNSIAADRWCVTRGDLKELRALVAVAIHDGTIVPTLQDPFDPNDEHLGPSIYTVVQQFIVPVTADAGGMSWALMKHPQGRRCDVFVTHAWTEGIFEFIDKVLASMPFSSRTVWCCMLANPQNLDMGGLIGDPKASPFALALRVAPTVLVIPNCKESIYRRLWCSYEASLAYMQNKVILTGRTPVTTHAKGVVFRFLSFYVIGAAIRSVLFITGVLQNVSLDVWMWHLPILLTLLLGICGSCGTAIGNRIGAITSGFLLACLPLGDQLDAHLKITDAIDMLSAAVFFVISEIDLIRMMRDTEETVNLRRGYSGTIADAKCSVQSDVDRIWAEIGSQVGAVDQALHVLMETGMSTPNLRRASERGVGLWKAAVPTYSTLILCFLVFPPPRALFTSVWRQMDFVNLALVLIWLTVFLTSEQDRRTFASTTWVKILTLAFVVMLIHFEIPASAMGCTGNHFWSDECLDMFEIFKSTYLCVAMTLSILVAMVSVGGVASLPCIGRILAEILVARNCGSEWSSRAKREQYKASTSSGEVSEVNVEDDTEAAVIHKTARSSM
eukprot:TRINITY_DN15785_c0_g3_i1.p1 TRINITY_DN15785_c0_g3~~TRINITY_DN15785_c0_g3_i1.p1  ORF type:complete len:572 (-),score=59.85 TRINITY_DN15785_c0_g3_i1:392-2107(-)